MQFDDYYWQYFGGTRNLSRLRESVMNDMVEFKSLANGAWDEMMGIT